MEIFLLLLMFLFGIAVGVVGSYLVGKWYANRMAKRMAEQMGLVIDMDEIAKFLGVNK